MIKRGDALIEVKNAVKVYGEEEGKFFALNNVSLKIDEGDFLVILGESGSGKSTLLNMIGGIDQLTRGAIFYKGKNISSFTDKELTLYRRNQIGFVFQFFNLINDLTVYQNVTLVPGANTVEPVVNKVLDKMGILEKKNKYPRQLSGGQQQRVSIARALNKKNTILLCDEPTGALDEKSGREILALLQELNQKEGKTIVVVTHVREVAKLANKVIRMKDGKIVDQYTNKEIQDAKEVTW